MTDAQDRPRHTTLAAWLVIGGSVLLLVAVADRLATLHSLATRESVAQAVRAWGWSVEDGLVGLRVWLMLLAGCAVTAALLGVQVLRRSRGARVGLTALALPIFLGGLATSSFVAAVVTAAIVLLWSGPSALWLSGQPVPARPEATPHREAQPPSAGDRRPGPPPMQAPPPQQPPHQWAPPPHWAPPPAVHAPARPDPVLWACVLTWTFCTIVILSALVMIAGLASSSSEILDQLEQSDPNGLHGLSRTEVVHMVYVVGAVAAVWAVAAVALAVVAFLGVPWGRTALMLSAAVLVALCVAGMFASPVLIIPAAVGGGTIALLSRPEVKAWYAAGKTRR